MGILVADEKIFANGLTLSNFAISIKGKFRGIEKTILTADAEDQNTTVYRLWFNAYFYASQAAYDADSSPIEVTSHQLDLTAAQASGDIFSAIYNHIKSNYLSTTDI